MASGLRRWLKARLINRESRSPVREDALLVIALETAGHLSGAPGQALRPSLTFHNPRLVGPRRTRS